MPPRLEAAVQEAHAVRAPVEQGPGESAFLAPARRAPDDHDLASVRESQPTQPLLDRGRPGRSAPSREGRRGADRARTDAAPPSRASRRDAPWDVAAADSPSLRASRTSTSPRRGLSSSALTTRTTPHSAAPRMPVAIARTIPMGGNRIPPSPPQSASSVAQEPPSITKWSHRIEKRRFLTPAPDPILASSAAPPPPRRPRRADRRISVSVGTGRTRAAAGARPSRTYTASRRRPRGAR